MTRRGSRAKKGQKEASSGQPPNQEPRRSQQSQWNTRASPRPRPAAGQESRQARAPQVADRRTNFPVQQPLQRQRRADEIGDSHRPPPPEPEPFNRDYDRRARALTPIRSAHPHDLWSPRREYVQFPRDERDALMAQRYPADYPRGYPHGYYRQRTPEYYRYQPSELIEQRLPFDGRGPPSSRMASEPRRRRTRSLSPAARPARSIENPGGPVPRVAESRSVHAESQPVHADQQPRWATTCGYCKREGHEVKDCVSKISSAGYVLACPRCNTKNHLYHKCPLLPAAGTREREEEDLYYLLTCRQNKPQIGSGPADLAALVRWTTPSLVAFPWTTDFTLRYHEDPQQAAAERDYDYSKFDFGASGEAVVRTARP
ncbi:hypothetical protein PG997_013543 [Apiospora hydei]|uniref:CCHC-type domain-containing protein n=1 Tax=Apiospora hydei TaxID=1337664 RepID=A0ABR1V6G6_9PEZI